MAGKRVNWTKALTVAALLLGAARTSYSQSSQSELPGSLTGRLTDLYSRPLEGVIIIARNQSTGAEARTTTTRNGAYFFNSLKPGEYALEASSPQLGRGRVEQIVVAGGHEARVLVAIEFEPIPATPILAAVHRENPPRAEVQPSIRRPDPVPVAPPPANASIAAKPAEKTPIIGPVLAAVKQPLADKAPTLKPTPAPEPNLAPANPEPKPALQTVARLGAVVAVPAAGTGPTGLSHTPVRQAAAMAAAIRAVQAAALQLTQARGRQLLAAAEQSGPAAPMTAAELQALPVSGRHWQDFVLDNAPTSTTLAGGQAEISLRGAKRAGTTMDGAGRRSAFGMTNASGQGSQGRGSLGQGGDGPAGIAQVGAGGHGFSLSESAIQTVETAAGNVGQEGGATGARMNVETQRGGDKLHGQGFLFDRQNLWGARNPSTQLVKETAPATFTSIPVFTPMPFTPPDRESTWGMGIGSRIRRNKLFWFTALDGHQRNDPAVSTVKHPDKFFAQPSNDQMQVLAARLGLSPANPVAEGVAAYSKLLEALNGLLGSSPRSSMQWSGFWRIDWTAAERHRFMLEGTWATWNAPGGGLTRAAESYGNHSFGSTKANEQWMLGRWEAFLTSNLLAVTQASVGRDVQQARPGPPSDFEQGFLRGNAWGQLPQMVVDSTDGFTIGNPSRFGSGSYPDEHSWQARESFDWIRGKLLVRAGFEFNHDSDGTSLLRNQTGTYHYANVENFISDALVFQKFGLSGELDPMNQHNCDQTGRVWRDSQNHLRGLGSLPCYSYYSQSMGPASWRLSTSDWAGYATAQWQAAKRVLLSAGLRWEREQLPPPFAKLSNQSPLLTQKLPALGNSWAPRVSLALGSGESRWPLLRLGYGMYFGRTENAAVEAALTQTGSPQGQLDFFIQPLDGFNPPTGTSNAPPFPYVLQGHPAQVIKPGAVEFAPGFRNPEVHQAIASLEERLPSHVEVTASAMLSLGRRLPISIDANLTPPTPAQTITYAVQDSSGAGPIKAAQITVPFYASWPSPNQTTGVAGRFNPQYQQITQIMSRANSTYEAGTLKVARHGRHGLSLNAHYTYAHAMDWNPNESSQVAGNDVLDPGDFSLEYGTSDLDRRHSAGVTAIFESPWKLHGLAGKFGNGWMVSGVGQFRGGLPYTMRTSGALPKAFLRTSGGTETVVGLGPGMNGSGGDNRVYGVGSDGRFYNMGRNTYRYPATWKADLRLAKRFDLGSMRQLEVLAESFNLFNHQYVTELETIGYTINSGTLSGGLPTLNFLAGQKPGTSTFGQPLNVNATNFYRERQFQFGLRMRF